MLWSAWSRCVTLADLVPDDVEVFVADTALQWAAEMGLIRIGEGINRVPAEILARFPGQPWRQMIAMRNFAAHQYDDLDPRRVWRTVTRDVPQLRQYVSEVVLVGLQTDDRIG